MDLSNLDKKRDTVVTKLTNPLDNTPLLNDDGTEMTIESYGKFSDFYRQVRQEQQNARLKRSARTQKITVTAEEIASDQLEFIAKMAKSWNITLDGSKPELTVAKVREVYTRFPWARDQVEMDLEDTQAFLT